MDESLKQLMQELGNAINDSLSDSDRITGVIGEIKRAGYDVFLVLEATIGFNKRDDSGEEEESKEGQSAADQTPEAAESKQTLESSGKIKFTSFLRALKIAVDDEAGENNASR